MSDAKATRRLGALVLRVALLGLCWWAISEGEPDALLIGALAVTLTAAFSLSMHPPAAFSLVGLLRFVPVFLWRSLAGGVDVARRALIPRMPIQPSLMEYRTELPEGLPRVVLANVISLLPGTLSADIDGDVLCLHVLSEDAGEEASLRRLERSVARIFA
jgi:multicomponent Na+:H+ antiporter subunit E